jgi:Fe-S-cluster containining protein
VPERGAEDRSTAGGEQSRDGSADHERLVASEKGRGEAMSNPISNPIPDPPPGEMFATRVLIQNIARQPDPYRSAEVVHHLIEREVIVQRRQSNVESSAFVAESTHRRIDKHVRERDAKDPEGTAEVKCTRGCTACCYQNVAVSEPEADLAYAAAFRAFHELDVERLRKQAQHGVETFQTALTHAERRCVMLKDDGDCAIYAARPAACRVYRVVSEPEACDTEKHPNGRTLALTVPHAEVVISASMRAFRYGSFAALLLEAIEGETVDAADQRR